MLCQYSHFSKLITRLASQLLQSALVFLDLPPEVPFFLVLVVAAAAEAPSGVAEKNGSETKFF